MTQPSTFEPDPARPPAAPNLADLVAPAPEETLPARGLGSAAWAKIGVLAALFAGLHHQQLLNLVQACREPNWQHGFLIPLFSLYLLYSRRYELAGAKRRNCAWGLPIILLSLAIQVLCVYPIRNDWFYWLNMLLLLLGIVLYLGGPEILKLAWVPIAFLAFGMPIPGTLYSEMALPLQNLAAKCSYGFLKLCGAEIQNIASHLSVVSLGGVNYPLEVAEMCSGMRSLMAFVALGAAMAYLEERPVWQRVVFVLCAVPIAIACNILRVTITCCAYLWDKPQFGQDFMHEFTGMLMLIPAFGMLWLVGKVLQSLFVEEEEEEEEPQPPAPAGPSVNTGAAA